MRLERIRPQKSRRDCKVFVATSLQRAIDYQGETGNAGEDAPFPACPADPVQPSFRAVQDIVPSLIQRNFAMLFRSITARRLTRSSALLLCAAIALTTSLTAAGKRPMKKLTYDPSAESIELFDGIENGSLDVMMIPKSSLEGNVFIENKSDKPLTIKLPKAVATVQVLKQGFGMGPGAGAGAGGGAAGGQQGGQGQQGGGGFGGGGLGGGGLGGGGLGGGGLGGGFFSVPPEKTVQIPITTVCLQHGKAEPRPKMTYKLVKLETYTSDPVLQELITMVGTGKLDSGAAQAAAWHLTDNMSWEELAAKKIKHVGGAPPEPYFSAAQMAAAQQLIAQANQRVREKNKENPEATRSRTEKPKL